MPATPSAVLLSAIDARAAAPVLTWYGPTTGQRIELSGHTLATAVAKATGLLVDELDVAPGDEVALHLGDHWQTAVWLLAAWDAGAVAVLTDPAAAGSVRRGVLVVRDDLGAALTEPLRADEVVVVPSDPFGLQTSWRPSSATDAAVATRSHPDHRTPVGTTDDAPTLVTAGRRWSGGELVESARAWLTVTPLGPSDRLLLSAPVVDAMTVVVGLVAPVLAATPVVWAGNLEAAELVAVVTAERVTVAVPAIGADLPAVSRVGSLPLSS
jgi:uncharacterized protein (TIGR03089 family)